MKRLLSLHILSFFISCLLTACHNQNGEPDLPHDNRTVLVYMLADNNLATTYNYDQDNIRAMGNALAQADINGHLVILLCRSRCSSYPTRNKTHRKQPIHYRSRKKIR